MPSFWVLKCGEEQTGVSVFQVDDGIDSGPIILQEKVLIGQKTQKELIQETKFIGVSLLVKAVDMLENRSVKYMPNLNSGASYYGSPTRKDVKEFYSNGKRFF